MQMTATRWRRCCPRIAPSSSRRGGGSRLAAWCGATSTYWHRRRGSLGDPHAGNRGLWEDKPRSHSGQGRFGNGPEPLRHCVLGPNQLHDGDEYIVSLVSPDKVKEVSAALMSISKEWFDDRYRMLVPHDYAPEYGD